MKFLLKSTITGLLTALTLFLSAQTKVSKEKTIKGDLYFKMIRLGSMYDADSASILKMNNLLDTMRTVREKSSKKTDNNFLDFYDLLEQNGLMEKPSFQIRIDSATIYTVFVDKNEYGKVDSFKLSDLEKEKMRVTVELIGKVLTLGKTSIIDCSKINTVKEIKGKTYWKK
ncbi:hypothetical protein ABIB40_000410 [Pedobacter sp. UYP30]|uniref:hypothetical protein n=1 Tax=Pedobacter sp. UYP30 TaxID=1756400 RepID=UPI003398A80F